MRDKLEYSMYKNTQVQCVQCTVADKTLLSQVIFFDVLLTVHLSIFISLFNQLDVQNFFSH